MFALLSNYIMKQNFLLIVILLWTTTATTTETEVIEKYIFSQDQVNLASEIIDKLESNHLVKKDYRAVKSDSFEIFIDRLDPNKNIFTTSEVATVFKDINANSTITNDLEIAFFLFNNYVKRYKQRYKTQINFLDDISENNLKSSRTLIRTLSEGERLNTLDELKKLWIDLSINDVIQLMLSGNTIDESVSKTVKRMENQLNYFEQTRNEDVFNIFVNSIASVYGPHTAYMSPKNSEDFDINMSLSLEGIGALLTSDGLYTSISSLVPGGPAEKTESLKPEDKIIGVGQDEKGEIIDVIGWRIDDVVDLIRGPKVSKVRLQIIPSTSINDNETKEIEIIRNVVKLEDQEAERKILSLKRNEKEYKVGAVSYTHLTLPTIYSV